MKNVIIYVRVSTDEQKANGYSIPHQLTILRKYCELRGWTIVNTYEEDFSAKNFNRPEYKSLFKFCKSHKREIDYVLITKWDRFSRNINHALNEIDALDNLGIEVNAVEEWIDFSIPQNKLLLTLYLTLPEIDNKIRANNVINGLRGSWKSGRWTGTAPKGYRNSRDASNKPILIKSEIAPLVSEAFELFATGLYDKQELRKMMWRKGLKLSKSQFPNLLCNHLYCGKVYIPEYKSQPSDIVAGIHEPIVTEELFDKVQSILNRGKKNEKRQYENLDDNAPLRGLINCCTCGGNLTSSASKGRSKYYTYYHCRNGCIERIPAATAHEALTNYLDDIAIEPEIADLFIEIKADYYRQKNSDRKSSILKHKEELRIAEERLINLEDKFANDKIDEDAYQLLRPKYKDAVKIIKTDLADIEDHEANLIEYVRSGVNIVQKARLFYEHANTPVKQKLVGSLFPHKFSIENLKCRTAQESVIIRVLRGFKEKNTGSERAGALPFLPGSPERNRTSIKSLGNSYSIH